MGETQVARERLKRDWRFYLISSVSFLLTLLLAAAIVYFWEEIQSARGYGYAGVFFAGILCGLTIIPAPTILLVFTLGGVLTPVFVGLVAGLGGAIGGITVYLTGAGVGTIWSKLQSGALKYEYRQGSGYDNMRSSQPRIWVKGEVLYRRLVDWVGGKGGSWAVFIVSAMVISPFYFAGLAAGSLRMGLLRFFLISWAGKTIKGLIVAYAGYWGLHFLLQWIGV